MSRKITLTATGPTGAGKTLLLNLVKKFFERQIHPTFNIVVSKIEDQFDVPHIDVYLMRK